MKIYGYVKSKSGDTIDGAVVELKNDCFETIYKTTSDKFGYYEITAEAGIYPFLVAVKDYAKDNLEYWCQNIDLSSDIKLDVSFDRIEIYGLHVFKVRGGYPSLMIYFRPMSLDKFQAGEQDISPDIKTINITIDGQKSEIYTQSKVEEFIGDRNVTAYLIQTSITSNHWNILSVEMRDTHGNYGKADIFNFQI